ncbi:MAG: type II toxin-antitoxin system VapC family toxin [Caulobacterales bacterium]
MTDVKVVDASAAAALLFGEAEAERVANELAGARLLAPALIDFELANVCVVKSRRRPDQRDAYIAALRLRERIGIEQVAVESDAVATLALDAGLSAYDASYLWLAEQLGAQLVTLDAKLARASAERARRD